MHPARIFTLLCLMFLFSCAFFSLGYFVYAVPFYLVWIVGVFLILFYKLSIIRNSLLIILVVILAQIQVLSNTPKKYNAIRNTPHGSKIMGRFVVNSEPRVVAKSQVFLVRSYSNNESGNVYISTNQMPAYRFGDVLEISGNLKFPTMSNGLIKNQRIVGELSYPEIDKTNVNHYAYRLDEIYFPLRRNLISVKDRYVQKIGQILPEPEAGLLSGILFGSRSELTTYIISILTITGTVHIIALSGYNITIIAKYTQYFTRSWGRNLSFIIPILGITVFVLATGLSASVVRAAIMGSMLLLANRLGRQPDSLNAILMASCIMAFINPFIVLYDIGFQLSFAAVSGIIFLQPEIEHFFKFLGPGLGPIMAGTVAAQLFSWPITAFYFGRISLVSIFANALILPFIPFLMGFGFLVITLGFGSLEIARLLGVGLWFTLDYIIRVAKLFANIKWASFSIDNFSIWMLIAYFALLLEVIYFIRIRKFRDAQ